MSYIRINKHYIHTPYLMLGLVEFLLLGLAAWLAIQFQQFVVTGSLASVWVEEKWLTVLAFGVILSCCTLSMGVYMAMVREGFASMVLRTVVSFFLLGSLALFLLNLLIGNGFIPQRLVFWGVLFATVGVLLTRSIFLRLVDIDDLKRRVVILGSGERALRLLRDLAPETRALSVKVVGCVSSGSEQTRVSPASMMDTPSDWLSFVKDNHISEVVIAPDERRRRDGASFPLEELINCKLAGVPATDVLTFYERELGKVDVSLLTPGWMLFSDGFKHSRRRDFAKRVLDLSIATVFLLVLWPLMLLTALAVALESGRPVLYHQERVGLNGKVFRIYKFRSMRKDAEKGGKAVWAQKNDNRITRVGAFIRNTRLDELPQLWNVLRGNMSFVGPRPERPEFVDELKEHIPFYDMRHKVKPGLMGWAQLKYPYGASVEDARQKLQYDLYYTKNHSLLMDLLIMIQTVEIILLGKGVH
ncbi:TIGR03013 family XrtA/PEP-CTERM system glycosyltransferase [Marinimicrobium alkaliphilum]|uniref:TIGR03013 family XrtA/PEP-CTERM system glycosyltransferase n=1 Tax=Marinimicrobium alkaliphilum TaxID=2202654 RepID=UPI001E4CB52B|nr:TIGR03013 family XrtA/PEP-CTERM system glycosyltransferase [Marinimicrobium alkaliphilum]